MGAERERKTWRAHALYLFLSFKCTRLLLLRRFGLCYCSNLIKMKSFKVNSARIQQRRRVFIFSADFCLPRSLERRRRRVYRVATFANQQNGGATEA